MTDWSLHNCCCWPMVEVPVHQRINSISLWQIYHSIYFNPIWQFKQTRQYWVLVLEYETLAHSFVAKPQRLLAFNWSSGTPLICIPEADAETRLWYSCLSCSFWCWVCPVLWLKFRHNWDLPIQSRMSFLDIYEANFDRLRLIIDISFHPRHASRATIKAPMCMYPSP